MAENHLRWDSLGEFLALAVSLEDLGKKGSNPRALVLSKALDAANTQFLMEKRSPSRKVNELDNRGSHFYLALYWARALADQDEDKDLKQIFAPLATALDENCDKIIEELLSVQGRSVDTVGYYHPDDAVLNKEMRPSKTFNSILDEFIR